MDAPPDTPRRGRVRTVVGWCLVALGLLIALFATLGSIEDNSGDSSIASEVYGIVIVAGIPILIGAILLRPSRTVVRRRADGTVTFKTTLGVGRITAIVAGGCLALVGVAAAVSAVKSMQLGVLVAGLPFIGVGLMIVSIALTGRQESTALVPPFASSPLLEHGIPPTHATPPGPTPPPLGPDTSYAERWCAVPLKATLVALVWLLALIALLVSQTTFPGSDAIIGISIACLAIYAIVLAMFAPYAVVLRKGVLQIGARGVPTIGRGWRRHDLPLSAVLGWDVVPHRARPAPGAFALDAVLRWNVGLPQPMLPKPHKPGARPPVHLTGDMRGPGTRHVLVVRVDPRRLPQTFPTRLASGYTMVDAAEGGWRDLGITIIGTHRPDALMTAMERALPGRRHHAERQQDVS